MTFYEIGRPGARFLLSFWRRRPTQGRLLGSSAMPIIGRPVGAPEWIALLERRVGRPLAPRKPGPKLRVEPATVRQARLV